MKLLKCKNLSKKIDKKEILKNINIEINEGDVIGLIGPNGSGKTTLIKCLVGLQKSNGIIKINGFDLKNDFEAFIGRVGAIVENPDFYNYMTGLDNLKLKSRLYSISNKKVLELVKLVGLENNINNKVSTYSLGMKMRLAICYALINNPNIIILDEPTNGLDPEGILLLKNIIKKLSKMKVSILISSHLLSQIESMCNKIIIIKSGEIIEKSNIEKIKNNNSYIFEVSDTKEINLSFKNIILNDKQLKVFCNKEFIPLIIESLVKSKIDIYSVKEENISLEEIFMKKIGENYD